MCAIIDTNVVPEIFGDRRPKAGEKFFDRINTGKLKIVIGGELSDELYKTRARIWLRRALSFGRVISINDGIVNELSDSLKQRGICRSNDPHVIALAQLSGARLLYSNDEDLREDFKDKELINPVGYIYSTLKHDGYSNAHKRLLNRTDLCSR